MNLAVVFGIGGVAPSETASARSVARWLEVPMLAVAVWVVARWYGEAVGLTDPAPFQVDIILWSLFALETILITALVKNKPRYLLSNWMNLFIIVAGISLVITGSAYAPALRILRLLAMVSLLHHTVIAISDLLSRNNLGFTIIAGSIFILLAGLVIAIIDPEVDDAAEGIWWAWVTITTVGYGDVVPVSTAGRIFGGFVIFIGIGLFSLITANMAAFFVKENTEHLTVAERKQIEQLKKLDDRIENLEKTIEELSKKITNNR